MTWGKAAYLHHDIHSLAPNKPLAAHSLGHIRHHLQGAQTPDEPAGAQVASAGSRLEPEGWPRNRQEGRYGRVEAP